MNTAKEVKAKNAENSKNIISGIELNDTMTVRVYSKSRAKGEVKFKKKRDSLTFKSTEDANTAINALVDAGAKIRKVEIIAEDGSIVNALKPTRVRVTPTAEEKAAKRTERESAKAEKAAAKAKIKAEKAAAKESAKIEKAAVKAQAKTEKVKAKKNVAEEALA
jgi:hypothetical protein